MHGYALKRALSPALPTEQRLNDGILYPLLKRMQDEGLVRKRVEQGSGARQRHVFHATEQGRQEFERWLTGGDDEHDEVAYDFMLGHPFLAKCLFFGALAPDAVRAKLAAQLTDCSDKLETFAAIREGMVIRDVDPYRIAVLDLGIAQQREKQRWLEQMIEDSRKRTRARTAA